MKDIKTHLIRFAVALMILSCVFPSSGGEITPPVVTLRDIAHMPHLAMGEKVQLADHATLFVPEGYAVPASGEIHLSVHFHGVDWFPMEEHHRRNATNPLLIYGGMEGSSRYQKPFEDKSLFGKLLQDVENYFKTHGAPGASRVSSVEISSFSAGYGAVREILKSPEYVNMITTLILADSCYASFATPGGGADRKPLPENMAPFISFARLAADGKKDFVMSFSQLVTKDYASTSDTARALVAGVGGEFSNVPPDSFLSAHHLLKYPLLYRFDKGGLHVWGYGGNDPGAHMALARATADFYQALKSPASVVLPVKMVLKDGKMVASIPRTPIPPPRRNVPGKRFTLSAGRQMYVPDFFKPELTTQTRVVVFFLGAPWCSEQNFYDARKNGVLVSIGEAKKGEFAEWGNLFPALLKQVVKTLADADITSKPLGGVCISSFSGGYTAVKEILSRVEYEPLISDIVLADSLYPPHLPDKKNALDPVAMEPFLKFARRAAKGGGSFWFSHLFPPEEPYRDNTTTLAAGYLIDTLGLERHPASGTNSRGAQLLYRAERGNLHILGYAGMTTQDHFEHFYALCDLFHQTSLPDAPAMEK